MASSLNKVLRKHRKKVFIALVVIFIILMIFGRTMNPDKTWHNPEIEGGKVLNDEMTNGTVQYNELEGGFYGIVGDNGKKYDPVNLPPEYAKDGLRVKFQVKEMEGMAGTHMWGEIVEVLKIEKLEYQSKNNK